MLTQWRTGQGGPTGLDYTVLPFVMDMNAVAQAERPGLFEALRIMEAEALKVMAEARERNKRHG